MGFPVALTRTDADGRFVFCGLGADTSTYLFASKAGYRLAERAVPLGGGNVTLEIELQR